MEPVAGNEYLPGSWEYAAISVYWDAHYQAGLFFLSYAVGVWAKTPKDEQRPHLLPALRNVRLVLLEARLALIVRRGESSSYTCKIHQAVWMCCAHDARLLPFVSFFTLGQLET